MSKFKKFNKETTLEIVEKFQYILNYISSTIEFWNKDKEWPTDLITDLCKEYHDKLEDIKQDIIYNKIN